jgi:hypothetical protein
MNMPQTCARSTAAEKPKAFRLGVLPNTSHYKIKNITPKTTGGSREIIDETFKSKASFKDMDEGEITE